MLPIALDSVKSRFVGNLICSTRLAKRRHLRKPTLEECNVNRARLGSQKFAPTISNLEFSKRDALEQASLLQVGYCPINPIIEASLTTAQKLRSVILRELKGVGKPVNRLRDRVLLSIIGEPQERKHKSLEVRNSHLAIRVLYERQEPIGNYDTDDFGSDWQ